MTFTGRFEQPCLMHRLKELLECRVGEFEAALAKGGKSESSSKRWVGMWVGTTFTSALLG